MTVTANGVLESSDRKGNPLRRSFPPNEHGFSKAGLHLHCPCKGRSDGTARTLL